jgi:hypothetical protein
MFSIRNILLSIGLLFCFVIFQHVNAQPFSYPFDSTLPLTSLDEGTKLTVLNSRLGSRFSMSYVAAERGFHCGTLGMDSDEHTEFFVGLSAEDGSKAYSLRTGSLPDGASWLQQQTLVIGLNAMRMTGTSPEGLKVTFTLVSPFTPSEKLEDTVSLKLQTAPFYYLLIDVANEGKIARKGLIKMAMKAIPWDVDKFSNFSTWRKGGFTPELRFKDRSKGNGFIALAPLEGMLRHFDMQGYNGLQAPFELAAGGATQQVFIIAGHRTDPVLHSFKENQDYVFHYNRFFPHIQDVLKYAQQNINENLLRSAAFENLLIRSQRAPEEKWLFAINFHTDLANSILVHGRNKQPKFYLTEGRFRHMNTIDVAHETELMALFIPWRLKMQIEEWTNYLATKEIPISSIRTEHTVADAIEGVGASELGPYLFHDVGGYPYVYEGEHYHFGPYMPVEENTNIVFLLYWYWKLTGDEAFVRRHLGLLDVLLQSLRNRDSDNSGIADYGMGWSTYDVSDAIKRSPENVYFGVKQMAAYLMAADMFEKLPVTATLPKNFHIKEKGEDGKSLSGEEKTKIEKSIIDNRYLRRRQAETYRKEASLILATLTKANKKYGYLPVSLDTQFEGWNQYSVLLGEGLFYAGLCGFTHPTLEKAAVLLKGTYQKAFEKSKTNYGIRLTSGEEPTWFSKIMVSDLVAQRWYGINQSTAHFAYHWNKNNMQAYQDGAFSDTRPWPGNWYPRGISSLVYLLQEQNFTADQSARFLKGLK